MPSSLGYRFRHGNFTGGTAAGVAAGFAGVTGWTGVTGGTVVTGVAALLGTAGVVGAFTTGTVLLPC